MKLTDLQEGFAKRKMRKQTRGWVVYDPVNEMYASGRFESRTDDIQDIHIFDDEDSANEARKLFGRWHKTETEEHADATEMAKHILAEPNRNWHWHGHEGSEEAVKWANAQLRSQSPDKDRWQVREIRVTYEF